MYYNDRTYSIYKELNQNGEPVYEMVNGSYPSQYTVKLIDKSPARIIFCMQSELGMELDDLIYLAIQNIRFFEGFKESFFWVSQEPKEKSKKVDRSEIEIKHNSICCPVYASDSFMSVKSRFLESRDNSFSY